MSPDELLAHVNELIRTMPSQAAFRKSYGAADELHEWGGRAVAILRRWRPNSEAFVRSQLQKAPFDTYIGLMAYNALRAYVFEAREDLRLLAGQGSVVIATGRVFEYFNEVRELIEGAQTDLFVIDPYLDAEFVQRYLPSVRTGCAVRLLTSPKKMHTLLPAVEMFAKESGIAVGVRETTSGHDRFIVIDGTSGYASGASFKDGAKNAPALITPVTDAFPAVRDTYEKLWSTSAIRR